MARERGVTEGTHQKRARSWDLWMGFLNRIHHPRNDTYLEKHDELERLRICGAFMHAVRRGDFGRKGVKGDTARTAMDNVAAAFVESGRRSPIVDVRGRTHAHIERQTKGDQQDGPATKHEEALPQ